jgi:hypothetical protein
MMIQSLRWNLVFAVFVRRAVQLYAGPGRGPAHRRGSAGILSCLRPFSLLGEMGKPPTSAARNRYSLQAFDDLKDFLYYILMGRINNIFQS